MANEPLLDRLQTLYSDHRIALSAAEDPAGKLAEIYSDDVVFKDPVHTIRGRAKLAAFMHKVYEPVERCEFVFLDIWHAAAGNGLGHESACIKWDMQLTHPRLNRGKQIVVRGMTEVHFSEQVYYHEDVYDMGAMIYQQVPVLGPTVNWINARLAR